MNMRTKYLIGAGAATLALALVAVGTASAAGITTGQFTKPAAIGTVSAVNGESITLAGKNGTTYTVDATNAAITKTTPGSKGVKGTSATITASQIQTGDTLSVTGTVSGDSIAATKIRDGKFMARGQMNKTATTAKKPAVSGKGSMTKPAAMGIVSAVNGNSITLTGKNGTTYTVDATNAAITKFTPGASGAKGTSATITISQIQSGDTLVVQGTVSGNSVTATKIMDGTFMRGGFGHGHAKTTTPAK